MIQQNRTPDTIYFTGWTSSTNITFANPSSPSTVFTMPVGAVTVTAHFEQVYTVTVSSTAGGTVTGGGTYAKDDAAPSQPPPTAGIILMK